MAALAKVVTRMAALAKDSRGCVGESVDSHGRVGEGVGNCTWARAWMGDPVLRENTAYNRVRALDGNELDWAVRKTELIVLDVVLGK